MPIADGAPYLGTNMSAKGNLHFEINTRIINTTATLNKLGLFWKKAPVSTTWKLRVHDVVITSKLLYGLESASLTNAEYESLDSCQIKALRQMLGIKHAYHSHVSNEAVMQRANQRMRLKEGKTITNMCEKLVIRQVKFMAHLLRAEEGDLTKTCTINQMASGFQQDLRKQVDLRSNGAIRL